MTLCCSIKIKIYEKAVKQYMEGNRNPNAFFNSEEREYLSSIGTKPQEMYDFVEDFTKYAEPDWETVLLITAVRRDYFLMEQKGKASQTIVSREMLPSKQEALSGIVWLPRLIEKAKGKLRGELSNEIMYGCAGDRKFFREHHTNPADFLKVVWQNKCGESVSSIVQFLKNK